MATRNSVDVGLSGSSGTGSFVGNSAPTISDGNFNQINDLSGFASLQLSHAASAVNYFNLENSATGNSVNLIAKGSDTNIQARLVGQGNSGAAIQGVQTNNAATAGYVGEYISSSVVQGSAVALTTVTAANVTTISLTAGDWQVWGNIGYTFGATTNTVILLGNVSSDSATLAAADLRFAVPAPTTTGTVYVNDYNCNVPTARFLLSGTTTIYLVAYAQFSVSTCAAYGGIFARRMR